MSSRPHSLDRQLVARLAMQSLVVWIGICGVVFLATHGAFRARQDEALAQKQPQVQLLLAAERHGPAGSDELKHRLRDFLVGHPDMALTLKLADGTLVLEPDPKLEAGRGWREVGFRTAFRNSSVAAVDARLALDVRADDRLVGTIGSTLLFAALVGSAIVSLAAHLQVRRSLMPLRELAQQTRVLTADTLDRRLDGSAQPAELQPLVLQFNELLARIQQAYLQLESFNADVAHELGTPLTTLIGTTELALRRPRAASELADALAGNLEQLQRMATMVRDMLFLSHADQGAVGRHAKVRIAAIAARVVSYHEAAFLEAELEVEVRGDAEGDFDVSLLERALSNLLANAARFADRGTTVVVDIQAAGPDDIDVVVVNQGASIPGDKLARVFDRFYRDDGARADADRHHGLGLAIVAAIARMHGGQAIARSAAGRTAIGLRLPRTAPAGRSSTAR